MSQRPAFDLAKLSAADRILVGGSLLLFIDSFLRWQTGVNAWGGTAGFAGVLMALFALLLVAGAALAALSVGMAGLTAGTELFGIIKFLFVVANHAKAGAWIGLVLVLVVAYGGYRKMQAERVAPPSSGFTG